MSDERFSRLARGVNLPNWFWYGPANAILAENVYGPEDFQRIRDLGFTYVRVPIDLNFVLLESDPDLLRDDALEVIDSAIESLVAHDLAVIVDLHSTDQNHPTNIFSGRLEDNPAFIETFDAFWAAFAAHLSSTDPDYVFLEMMNEPVYENNTGAWPPIQERLAATVRANAPQHTIIATSALWSNIDTFVQLRPLADANVIYNFHFYEPFIFTHQGSPWVDGDVQYMRKLPYPSSPEGVEAALPQIRDNTLGDRVDSVVGWAQEYGYARWDRNLLASRIQQAVRWSQQHGGLRLMSNEFGVYKPFVPNADRLQWLRDTRSIFEQHNIAWAVWNYAEEGLGLYVENELDLGMVEALGLTLP